MATRKQSKILTDEEMKTLLDNFIEAKTEENQYYRATIGLRPRPNPPATEAELRALDEHLQAKGLQAPAAYKQFLRIYNGVDQLLYPLSLYSIAEVIGKCDFIEAMFDICPGCRDFVIAGGTNRGKTRTGDIVAFDIQSKAPDGSYKLVWITEGGRVSRNRDFVTFLRAYLRVTKETIAQDKAAAKQASD